MAEKLYINGFGGLLVLTKNNLQSKKRKVEQEKFKTNFNTILHFRNSRKTVELN